MDGLYSSIFKNILLETCDKQCEEKNYKDEIITENAPENEKINKRKKYNQNFFNKHKDEIKIRIECDVCGGFYTYYNKSSHNKTSRHLRLLNKI